MPWRSMSFIVNTCTRESRTATFSRSSRLRTPMSTVCSGRIFGDQPPICASSLGSDPRAPRAACRARCRSATSPVCSCRRARRPTGGRWAARASASPTSRRPPPSPRRGCGRHPARAASRLRTATRARSRKALVQTFAISRAYLRRLSLGDCVSGIGAGRSPLSATVNPSAAICSPSPAMRNADGPMSTPRLPAPRSNGTPMM